MIILLGPLIHTGREILFNVASVIGQFGRINRRSLFNYKATHLICTLMATVDLRRDILFAGWKSSQTPPCMGSPGE